MIRDFTDSVVYGTTPKRLPNGRIKYPDDHNPILEYWKNIKTGKVTVSDKIKRTYEKLANDCKADGEFYFSSIKANHAIEFVETFCRHSKGKMGKKPIRLELWEKAMLGTIFGFVDGNGLRKFRRAVLIIGKKNGKSLLDSAIGTYMQVGDGENGPEVYAVATKKDQAKIVWLEAKSMVRKSPSLRKRIKPLVAELSSVEFNDGIFKPLASDSDTLDGLNVHCVIMDEFHQWKNGRALYDIMADGVSAREQPLVIMTSTAGTVREDIYDEIYDEATMTINGYKDNSYIDERSVFFVYELDHRDEWQDETKWEKANPGIGTIKNLSALTEKVNKAKQNPNLIKNLVCKEFNIRETSQEAWLSFDDYNIESTYDIEKLKPRYGIGGVDLSSTTDLTCATMLFKVKDDKTIYIKQMYWLPEETLAKRETEDQIPYRLWVDRGLMRTSQGNRVNPRDVVEWFEELQEKDDIYLYKLGYDSWSATTFVADISARFGSSVPVPVIQGKKTLSAPMKLLGADLAAKKINYNNNPITKWCIGNTSIDIDRNNNIQPVKGSKSRKRIDGLAAMLDAYVVYENERDNYLNML